MDEYIARNRGMTTQSKIKCFLKCPIAFYLKYVAEVWEDAPKSDALELGTAFDDYMSYGKKQWEKIYYALSEGQNSRNKEVKEGASGRHILTASKSKIIMNAVDEAYRQPLMKAKDKNYEAQKTLFATYKNLKLKASLDRFSDHHKEIRDYKFMRSVKDFEWDANKNGYFFQAAFYTLLNTLHRQRRLKEIKEPKEEDNILIYNFYFDVIEKQSSRSCVFAVPYERMEQEFDEIYTALDLMSQCYEEMEACEDKTEPWVRAAKMLLNRRCDDRCPTYRICPNAIQTKYEILH